MSHFDQHLRAPAETGPDSVSIRKRFFCPIVALSRRKILPLFLLFAGLLVPAALHAFEPMLPLVHERGADISGWLMSEKLDGVRGYWDGKRLYSKNGIEFHPPPFFTENFPPFAVEGELWTGRNGFEQTLAIVMKKSPHNGWRKIRFGIFDVPAAPGGFEQRLGTAAAWFAENPSPFAFVIEHRPVANEEHLLAELRKIEGKGGEGLMLRKPGSPYSKGRSSDILKVKSYHDMEAVVIAHLPGRGRNSERLGSLLAELPDGTRFKIGTGFSDAQREDPPPVGSLITFKHYGFYQSGIPRFPSFLRIRRDP